MFVKLRSIAIITNSREIAIDDDWGNILSEITLNDDIPIEAIDNIDQFSHLEIIYFFDKAPDADIVFSGYPRGNKAYPKMGIFGQRKKDRPNHIGLCTVELVEKKDRTLTVKYLDAINGTPVLDIKPVFREFSPQGMFRQPAWVADLMSKYW